MQHDGYIMAHIFLANDRLRVCIDLFDGGRDFYTNELRKKYVIYTGMKRGCFRVFKQALCVFKSRGRLKDEGV